MGGAYVAGINHAGRAEFEGKSRRQVLRAAYPEPQVVLAFVERLHAEHNRPGRPPLPSQTPGRSLLDAGSARFRPEANDAQGRLIQNSQEELDRRAQEHWLREFAEVERGAWPQELEQDYAIPKAECAGASTLDRDLAFRLRELTVFGGLSNEAGLSRQIRGVSERSKSDIPVFLTLSRIK